MQKHRNVPRQEQRKHAGKGGKQEQGKLERLAKTIDPPSREIDDRDLIDPGRMTPDAAPTENRS